MEELNSNTTGGNGFNNSNMDGNYSYYYNNNTLYGDDSWFFVLINLLNRITIGIELPLILIVMIAVFSQVKKGQDAPVYVINLLASDVIQLCCRIPLNLVNPSGSTDIFMTISYYAFIVSVGFMVCISCERYLVVAKPLWYRFRRNIKTYVVVSIVVWILPAVFALLTYLINNFLIGLIFLIVFLLLPFPFFIFFLVGTIKTLSGAHRVQADEKRRIVAIQVVVLIIYTLLYLPIIILLLEGGRVFDTKFGIFSAAVSFFCVFFSPLADTTLYLLSQKSFMDKILASICYCKTSHNLESRSTDYESRTATNTETV
uniref:G-protein coupled receptors family 1 profile domain-containing protein n=1 Tax=Poecilia reticulata TaxID=8081 RepID=A0A3P9MVZ8_POERE